MSSATAPVGRLMPSSSTSHCKQTKSSPSSPVVQPKKCNISPAPSMISLCSVMDAPVNIKLRYKDVSKYLIWAECPLDESAAAVHNKGFVDFISTSPTNPKTSHKQPNWSKFSLPRKSSSAASVISPNKPQSSSSATSSKLSIGRLSEEITRL